jgi:Na+/H+ antiporter NhaD/arsenite permease-like protein
MEADSVMALLTVVPFVALLLAIAILPLAAPHFWHKNANRALVALSLAAPIVLYLLFLGQAGITELAHALLEYGEFILMLGALYTVAGGIIIEGRFRPTPWTNTLLLTAGAILANFVGTTGASMLLARPLFRINQPRRHHVHVAIFFIIVVSNVGGLLTPLGDPPLFLGFLRGVPFTFTLTLWPHWLLVGGTVLVLFFIWDLSCTRREPPVEIAPSTGPLVNARGLVNIPLLLGVVLAVLLRSPALGGVLHVLPEPWPELIPGLMMLGMAGLSLALTPSGLRRDNGFTWAPLIEVAVLFLGLFITMVPALAELERRGPDLGVTEPWQFFWATGILSAFLDNAPTYLSFATIAAHGQSLDALRLAHPRVLQAISAGAVFLGALTYIGNGPNFMVKAIAEGMGYRMPSFFAYLAYASAVLLPILALVTWLFFW